VLIIGCGFQPHNFFAPFCLLRSSKNDFLFSGVASLHLYFFRPFFDYCKAANRFFKVVQLRCISKIFRPFFRLLKSRLIFVVLLVRPSLMQALSGCF